MLIHRRNSSGFVWFCSLLSIVAVLSAVSFAQEDQTPKQEIFTGYQYLHPGANVPSPAGTLNSPVPQNMPDMPAGLGLSYTYNFSQHLGLQADFGRNWKSGTD